LVIPKLERPEALQELDAILDVSDGVMVARGDLGVEIAPERLPSLQKEIIRQANARRRIVITATQMLESMTEHPRPTRAEATDVANAVFDGSDALMLSAETAIGRFPVQSVETMARIILDAEAHASRWGHPLEVPVEPTEDDALATTHAARELSRDGGAAAVAVFTRSGRTARLMSKVRPQVPILGFTPDAETFRQLCLFWGVTPHLIPTAQSVEDMIRHVEQAVLASGRMSPGQKVVMVASLPVGAMGPANFVYLHTLGP
jgi:pyruvate kinase